MKSIFSRLGPFGARSMEGTEFPYFVDVVAENLTIPWAIDFSEDGTIYFTERTGAIWKMQNGTLKPQPIYQFGDPFIARGEGGLLGIALDPHFTKNRYLYVMHSYLDKSKTFNRVVRLVEHNQELSFDRVICTKIDEVTAQFKEEYGRLREVVQDTNGTLYLATGNTDGRGGVRPGDDKILRLTPRSNQRRL